MSSGISTATCRESHLEDGLVAVEMPCSCYFFLQEQRTGESLASGIVDTTSDHPCRGRISISEQRIQRDPYRKKAIPPGAYPGFIDRDCRLDRRRHDYQRAVDIG